MYKPLLIALFISSTLFAGINHAPLDSRHFQSAERFIQKNFKTNNHFDYHKAQSFLEFLKKNAVALRSDIYETTVIEVMDVRLQSSSIAKEEAAKQLLPGENNLIYAYENYIIPMMEEILQLIANGAIDETIDAKLDKFIEFFHVYYIPDKPRNTYSSDKKWYEPLLNQFGYTFHRNTKMVEANNLVVNGYEEEIAHCLGFTPAIDNPLVQKTIEKLKKCGFDISLLNPIENPFFNDLNDNQKEARKTDFEHLFPRGDEDFRYEFIIYTGLGSPKFVGSFYKTVNGERKKVTFKVKVGQELHVDPAATMLGKLVGLHQDHSKYYKKMRFHLREGQTVDNFIAQFSRKYTNYTRSISAFITARSPRHAKDQWFEIHDLSIEIRDPHERRLSPFDSWGWDLPNRREHRGILLWYAFIAAKDLKPGNHVVKLREKNGKHKIIYSPQDVGYSLGSMVDIRYPFQFSAMLKGRTINFFMPSFMSHAQNSVRLFWRDGHHIQGRFYSTTYNDLRWMARKITKLSLKDIEYGIRAGGFPEPVVKLYTLKLGHRMNEIIRGFDLVDEVPLLDLPDLKEYNDPPYVKNGLLIANGFDGHFELSNESPRSILADSWANKILKFIPIDKLYHGLRTNMGIGVGSDFTVNIPSLKKKLGKPLKYTTLIGNIKFSIERTILLNQNYYARSSEEMGKYIVKDTVSASFNLEGDKVLDVLSKLPLRVTGSLKIYEKSFSHIQTVESFSAAALAPIKIFKHIKQGLVGTSVELDRGDVYKVQDGYGFGVGIGGRLNISNSSFYALDVEAGIGWNYSRPIYIYRDELGDLFYFKESRKEFYARASVTSMGLDFLFLDDYPLLGVHYQHSKISSHAQIFKFEGNYDNHLVSNRWLQEARFRSFLHNPEHAQFEKNKILEIQAQGFIEKFSASFLLTFNASRAKRYFKISVDTGSKKKDFYRYNFQSEHFIGFHSSNQIMPNSFYPFTRNKTQWSVTVELEENNIENSVAFLGYQDFRLRLSHENLLHFISNLNQRFAPTPKASIFETAHLPSKKAIPMYYKLYSNMRVSVGVGKFIKSLDRNKLRTIKSRLVQKSRELKLGLPKIFYYVFKRGLNKIIYNKRSPKKQVKALAKLFHYINKQDNSIRLMKAIFGEENIFVYGEILGIYPSFTLTQELEGLPSRTFGAKSWGGEVQIPPIRKLLKNHLTMPLYLHVLSDDISGDIFGQLPSTNGFEHL